MAIQVVPTVPPRSPCDIYRPGWPYIEREGGLTPASAVPKAAAIQTGQQLALKCRLLLRGIPISHRQWRKSRSRNKRRLKAIVSLQAFGCARLLRAFQLRRVLSRA